MKLFRVTAAVALAFCCISRHAPAMSFHGLGDLPGGRFLSLANGISGDGLVAVGDSSSASTGPDRYEAFRWTNQGGMIGLGILPGGFLPFNVSSATASSATGSVIVGRSASALGTQAFRWTAESGMVGLGDLPGGIFGSIAHSVSEDGSVIVGRGTSAAGNEAYRWTQNGGMVGLGHLGGVESEEGVPPYFYSDARAVSSDGSVVVGISTTTTGLKAFRWTITDGMIELQLSAGESGATALSADGSVIVGHIASESATGAYEAFRWSAEEGVVRLGFLPGGGISSYPTGVSADGSAIVGYSGLDSGDSEAFLWTQEFGMRSLRSLLIEGGATGLTGWILTEAMGISADGRTIVGNGYNPSGQLEGWIATFGPVIPEPSTFTLLLFGAAFINFGRRLRTR